MLKKAFRFIFTMCGMLLGLGVSKIAINRFSQYVGPVDNLTLWVLNGFTMFFFGIIFYFIFSRLESQNELGESKQLLQLLKAVPVEELIPGLVGLSVGVFISNSLTSLVMQIKALGAMYLNIIISVLLYIGFGVYGWMLGVRFGRNYKDRISSVISSDILKKKNRSRASALPKVFDTSVIIDGRIHDILNTGFLEGDIIIPDFVLVELRHISDSADDLKRQRGRRGLDILKSIQENYGIDIYDTSGNKEISKIPEVDLKLLKLAEIMNGVVVTNDYNLNKVAGVQNIGVLNINELANTLKPAVLPGEEMKVTPVKEGKGDNQSVAYLDDGTMIVVQNGKKYIGKSIDVTVSSVLQTSAGRMIFAKVQK